MDTRTAANDVEAQVARIKTHAPEVYKAIQAKAQEIGTEAFRLVRRGLRGEPNCFYAVEQGTVYGAPFTGLQGAGWIAQQIAQFGCAHVCIFPEVSNGTN